MFVRRNTGVFEENYFVNRERYITTRIQTQTAFVRSKRNPTVSSDEYENINYKRNKRS